MIFDQIVKQILEDREIPSPLPNVYKLEKTDKGLYKRTYISKKNKEGEVCYFKDKQGAVLHNLDGPAISYMNLSAVFYYIDGEPLMKAQWEKKRLTYNIKDKTNRKLADSILDI